jgi:nucleotide-binding universal stress UspA family protein
MTTEAQHSEPVEAPEGGLPEISIARIAAAVDLHPEGRDAAKLGAALAEATGADLALVTIEPDLPLVIPRFDWKRVRRETAAMLAEVQDSLAPRARTIIDADLSIPQGIERVVRKGERDLLVVGSSPKGSPGTVWIGRRTRQLLHELRCPLVVTARGFSARPAPALRRIGVGFEGSPESRLALAAAATIALGCNAELMVRAVLDDRPPSLARFGVFDGQLEESWDELMSGELESLNTTCAEAVSGLNCPVSLEVRRGRPATLLDQLSDDVDLLVLGSRRWGAVTRVLLGGTGEVLMHGARSSIMVVPRPRAVP